MAELKQTGAEEPSSGNPGLSPLSILRTIWKRKVRIMAAWVLFSACAVVVVRLLPAVYEAETKVLVDSQKIPEKFVAATVASDLDERIAAIRQTIMSGVVLKKIIDDFGLYQEERKTHFEEEVLDIMRKDITITLEPVGSGMAGSGNAPTSGQTVAFRIGYQGSNPEMVARVANRLTDLYVEQNAQTRESEAAGTSDFLDTQLVDAKKRLDTLEAAVSAYKVQHNGELPEQEQSLAAALSRLQTELEANRDAINRAQQTKVIQQGNLTAVDATIAAETRVVEDAQRSADASGPVPLPGDPSAANPRQSSEVMQEQLEVLRGRYSDSYPDVVRLKADIEKVKRVEEERKAAKSATAATAATDAKKQAGGSGATPAAPRSTRRNWRAPARRLLRCASRSPSLTRSWTTARPNSSVFCGTSTVTSATSIISLCANRKWLS